jgi:ParB family chromosome partitioning protein
MQRKDLTTWEESDGLAAMCQRFGYTHEEVARKVGKSRSSITEALSIAALPTTVREKCRRADIQAKSILLQIVRQPDEEAMNALIEIVAEGSLTRNEARALRKGRSLSERGRFNRGSDKPHVFRFQSPNHDFNVELRFFKSTASNEDVIDALRTVIDSLNA